MNKPRRHPLLAAPLIAVALLASGCEPVSMTMMSVGASTGLAHTLGGIVYRTFTAPAKRVEQASRRALSQMGMEVVSRDRNENGEVTLRARARDRDISVLLEPLTARTTRVRAIATNGLLTDGATASEIVQQTENALGGARTVSYKGERKT